MMITFSVSVIAVFLLISWLVCWRCIAEQNRAFGAGLALLVIVKACEFS